MRDAERKISMRLEKYFEDPEILHVGTEETRCCCEPQDENGESRRNCLSGNFIICPVRQKCLQALPVRERART